MFDLRQYHERGVYLLAHLGPNDAYMHQWTISEPKEKDSVKS